MNNTAIPPVLAKQKSTISEEFFSLIANSAMADLARPVTKQDKLNLQHWLKLLLCSDYVKRQLLRNKQLIMQQWQAGEYQHTLTEADYAQKLTACLATVTTEAQLLKVLRDFRQQQMVRIAYRDINALADLAEVLYELSTLADCIIRAALQWLEAVQQKQFGYALDSQGRVMPLMVVAMGKLGARELNFSSDVDLIFAFAEHGETLNGPRSISHNEYFIKLGQRLINALHKTTVDGFVFRVDMRLRPFGQGGPLAMSYAAVEDYYHTHGREWERYALIKARAISGTKDDQDYLYALFTPFIYRRYIDFGVFAALREMKSMIAAEVLQKKKEANIKLGAGGIREIEFMVQVLQLLKGGCDNRLHERQVQKVLPYIASAGLLPRDVVMDLLDAYQFLRCTEHRIQQINDQQCHDLPLNDYPRAQLYYALGYADWDAFALQLQLVRSSVQHHFEQLLQLDQTDHMVDKFLRIWQADLDDQQAAEILQQSGFQNGMQLLSLLKNFRHSRSYLKMSREGSERLDRLIPLVLNALTQVDDVQTVLDRILSVLQSICRRSVYMLLLIESPSGLTQLVKLCAASPWITRLLTRYPALFDELLDDEILYAPLQREQLFIELQEKLSALDSDDLEQRMEILRYFKQSQTLRVAAADITDVIPVMQVSDYLSWIAQAILHFVLQTAWHDMVCRYGFPQQNNESLAGKKPLAGKEPLAGKKPLENSKEAYGFAIIGFGKLGGLELGYGSDLDMVFVYADEFHGGMTSAKQSVDNLQFYSKLSLRILHILQTRTHSGILYEADMRLRPNGQSGLICTSLRAFKSYQLEKAWLWEHQALVRARFICGDQSLNEYFQIIRQQVLSQQRNTQKVKKEVRQMREKMRLSLLKRKKNCFDLKQGTGGIVDIEFIVQFLVLNYAAEYPQLVNWTDNIRILQSLADTDLLSKTTADNLIHFYRLFRDRLHHLSLQEEPGFVDQSEFLQETNTIQAYWREIMN